MSTPSVQVRVSGEYACFTRPETKVERFSYPVITPSAARNVLDSICWRPQMRWVITSIAVLKPVRFMSVLRNEVQSKLSPSAVKKWMRDPSKFAPLIAGAGQDTDGTPRNTTLLRDVAYWIEAFPLVFDASGDNTPTKYVEMMKRRVEKGQCFSRPYLGCREFAAEFGPPQPDDRPISDSFETRNDIARIQRHAPVEGRLSSLGPARARGGQRTSAFRDRPFVLQQWLSRECIPIQHDPEIVPRKGLLRPSLEGMHIRMQMADSLKPDAIGAFLESSEGIEFAGQNREEIDNWVKPTPVLTERYRAITLEPPPCPMVK